MTKNKKNTLYWSELGMKYLKAGDYLKAIECFAEVLKNDPTNIKAEKLLGGLKEDKIQ